MSSDIRKFKKGIQVEPVTSTDIDSKGEIEVLNSSGKLNYHNGTTASPVVTEDHSAVLTNKTLTSPVINGGDINGVTLSLNDSDSAFNLEVQSTSTLTADHTLTIDVNDADRTLTISGNSTIDGTEVKGPASATNDAIARFDGTTGKLLDNSLVTISDAGTVSGATQLNVDNLRLDGNTISSTDTNGNINLSANGTGDVVIDNIAIDNNDINATTGNLNLISTAADINLQATAGFVNVGSTNVKANSTGDFDIIGSLSVDNIDINANTISSTNTNGDITLSPNGSGNIDLNIGTGSVLLGNAVTVTNAGVVSGATQLNVDNLRLDGNTLSSTDTNGNIVLDANGTGQISIEDVARVAEQSSSPATPASGYTAVYSKTDGYLYYKNDSGAERRLEAGTGGINYILNSDFEGGTTGWATYADAAGTAPVDGTGGSPNITFTQTTSSPLRGTASGLITKDAANRQGQGISYDFTIDSADKSKQLAIQFDYEASANYTGSSGTEYMSVYVYDVTNAVQIPASFLSSSVPQGSGTQQITFNSTTSTSYRLEFHIAGTGTSSWTYKIDNVQVGPQEVTIAPAIGDWQSYTPTFTGFGTVSGVEMYWRRVGDSVELKGRWTNGTVTATEAQMTLPSGLTSTNVTTVRIAGGMGTSDTTGDNYYVLSEASKTYVTFSRQGAGRSALSKSTANADFNTGATHSIFAVVPIANWSSNIQLANSRVEYASNSGMGDTDDTSNFVNDPTGNLIPTVTYTGQRSKRIRFKNPVQSTDAIVFQVDLDGSGKWIEIPPTFNTSTGTSEQHKIQNGVSYGMGRFNPVSGSSTDFNVQFGQYAFGNSTYGAAGTNWASDSARWRVVKYSNAVPVESAAHSYQESKNASATNFPTSGQYGDATSLVLQPGEYDLTGVVTCFGQTNTTVYEIGISTTSGNSNAGLSHAENRSRFVFDSSNFDITLTVPNYRVLVTIPTTYYLKVTSSYTGSTPQYAYRFSARRIN